MPVKKAHSLTQEINAILPAISQPETEDSWDAIAESIVKLGDICKAYAHCTTEVVSSVRSVSRPLTSAMASERTRLSGVAINLIASLAPVLGHSFEQLLPQFLPSLLLLCARTNKVLITRARTCILTIVETTQSPLILPFLVQSIQDKSITLRLTAMECILAYLHCINPPDIEKESSAQDVESAIRSGARDANADVRKVSRKVFEAYKALLPRRVESFIAPLSPTTRKYLDIPNKPSLPASVPMPPRPRTAQGHYNSNLTTSRPLPSSTSAPSFRGSASKSGRCTPSETTAPISSRPTRSWTGTQSSTSAGVTERAPPSSTPASTHPPPKALPASAPITAVRRRTISAPAKPGTGIAQSRGHKEDGLPLRGPRRVPAVAPTPNSDGGVPARRPARPPSRVEKTLNNSTSATSTSERQTAVLKKSNEKPDKPAKTLMRMPSGTLVNRTTKTVRPLSVGSKPGTKPAWGRLLPRSNPQPRPNPQSRPNPQPHSKKEVTPTASQAPVSNEASSLASSLHKTSPTEQLPNIESTSVHIQPDTTVLQTPISSLLSSIQHGFLDSPTAPLSPPQSYIDNPSKVAKAVFGTALGYSHTQQGILHDGPSEWSTTVQFGRVDWPVDGKQSVFGELELT